MPAVDAFFDSNVLIYAMSDAGNERAKRDRSLALIGSENFGTSYQVLMETWVVAAYKMRQSVAAEKVAAFIEKILVFPCVQGTASLYREAFNLAAQYQIHPYDAAIVAAARELGAKTLFTEDLSDGQIYGGVKAVNPFRSIHHPPG